MAYGHLREGRRRMHLPLLEIFSGLLLLAAIVLAMIELARYSSTKDSLQTDLTIAGLQVGGMDANRAQERWEQVYISQPVQLYFGDHLILLNPADVGFRTNSDAMLAEARARSTAATNFWLGFWNYLGRRPVAAVSVPLDADYNEALLREFLTRDLAGYNTQPQRPRFRWEDPDALVFEPGQPGLTLDVDEAMRLIEQALFSMEPEQRVVHLPLVEREAPGADMTVLREAIIQLMEQRGFAWNGAQTLASVYIMDLESGDELSILADVAHSAVSTIKIPIMINLFRQQLLVDQDTAYLLTASILCSENSASNFLMQIPGQGQTVNAQLSDGLRQVSCTAQELGAERTYISAPLRVGDPGLLFEAPVCRPQVPANATYNAQPDPYAQTTAEDMGLLLMGIYDCAYHDSGLKALYPNDITQTECRQMLELLSSNRIDRLIELGVPEGTRVAHKNGWGPETTGDAWIVFSPGGDYIFVMYIYEEDLDQNNVMTIQTWELIEEVSRLTYNFFNPDAPLTERREPINPFGAIHCVTVMDPADVDLNDVDANRLDENGNPLPTACYGGPSEFDPSTGQCAQFNGWGAGP